MNLALVSTFHNPSLEQVLHVKRSNAWLLSHLVERFEDKYELKVEYADYLITRLLTP